MEGFKLVLSVVLIKISEISCLLSGKKISAIYRKYFTVTRFLLLIILHAKWNYYNLIDFFIIQEKVDGERYKCFSSSHLTYLLQYWIYIV